MRVPLSSSTTVAGKWKRGALGKNQTLSWGGIGYWWCLWSEGYHLTYRSNFKKSMTLLSAVLTIYLGSWTLYPRLEPWEELLTQLGRKGQVKKSLHQLPMLGLNAWCVVQFQPSILSLLKTMQGGVQPRNVDTASGIGTQNRNVSPTLLGLPTKALVVSISWRKFQLQLQLYLSLLHSLMKE